jgi:hypothetical protein
MRAEVYDNKYFLVLGKKILVYDIDKTSIFEEHTFCIFDFTDVNH